MRLLLPSFLALAVVAPLSGQSRPFPSPHPAPLLWAAAPPAALAHGTPMIAGDSVHGGSIPTGVIIGGVARLLLTSFGCGLEGGDNGGSGCGLTPYLIGILAGGITGAMIDSAFSD